LDDYVWVDDEMRAIVQKWLDDGALPHVLFSGLAGTGKTSLAKLLFKLLGIPSADLLYINASRERQIDAFQTRVVNFVDSWAMGPSGIKYVLLDEADKMSPLAQGLLRNEMETYSDVCRFVMTCNEPRKIINPIHSRVQELRFPSLDREAFTIRLAEILEAEKIEYEAEILLSYVDETYPDLRKCLGLAQQNTREGKLWAIKKDENNMQDYLATSLELFRAGRFLEGRKVILANLQPEEYDDFYRTLYRNLSVFGSSQEQQDEALLIIRRSLVHNAVVCDLEINLAACLVELAQLSKS
jgi:DNA polymerase III delta prime subunit